MINSLFDAKSRYFIFHFKSLDRVFFSTSIRLGKRNKRKKLVIIGTGWSGYSLLRTIDKCLYDVIVVSRRNHFLFTPLLASTTVGTIEFRSIIEPIRNINFREREHFHLSNTIGVNFIEQSVTCESVLKPGHIYDISYDILSICVGALPSMHGIPGVKECAFFLKELTDARLIRNRLLSNLELSVQAAINEGESQRLRHVVIVGGGPTGVEFGAELYDFLEQDVSRLYNLPLGSIQVTLIESNKILGAFDKKLRDYAEKKFKDRKGFNLVQSTVREVQERAVTLTDGTSISCGLVVWSTGLSAHPFIESLGIPKDKRGLILTDDRLRILGQADGSVYAIGDCATIDRQPYPQTAQVAEGQGRYLARILNGAEDKGFSFKSLGMLAYIGEYKGVSDLPDFKLLGVTSWFLWRSAYLTRLGSWRNRFQVPFDWTKTLMFGRDISRF